jgi:hypothetical protein
MKDLIELYSKMESTIQNKKECHSKLFYFLDRLVRYLSFVMFTDAFGIECKSGQKHPHFR